MSGKKELIRQAAIKAIAERGYHEATIDLISDRAGVSVGTIYNYFRSKQDIHSYIFEVEYNRRAAFLEELESREDMDALEKVEAILRFHFDQLKANPDLAAVLVREKYLPCSWEKGGAAKLRGLPRLLAQLLQSGIQEGDLRPHDPVIVAPCLMGAVEAGIVQYVLGPEEFDHSHMDRAADEIMNLLRGGIRPEGRES